MIAQAAAQEWELVSSDYCEEETQRNLTKVGARAARNWKGLLPLIRWVQADLALDKPLVFPKAKDRPVVITALAARADWLLTLDEGDFHQKTRSLWTMHRDPGRIFDRAARPRVTLS